MHCNTILNFKISGGEALKECVERSLLGAVSQPPGGGEEEGSGRAFKGKSLRKLAPGLRQNSARPPDPRAQPPQAP